MNTEPPVGDELQRMLVSMKQHVLEHAGPRPRRRRRVGLVVGVVSVLLLGAAGGSVALGLIPTADTAAPAPVAPSTPEPSVSETPTGEPVVEQATPTPVPTPTPTAPSRAPYSPTDPSTWTISGAEVGPVALGGPIAGELDDLTPAYVQEPDDICPAEVTWWTTTGSTMTVVERDGVVWGVMVSGRPGGTGDAPSTAEGIGLGSTLAAAEEAYPDLRYLPRAPSEPAGGPYAQYTTERSDGHVTFQLGDDGKSIASVWVSTSPSIPWEFCG